MVLLSVVVAWFCLVLFGFVWFWLVLFGLGWFWLLLNYALFSLFLLDLLGFACCLVWLGVGGVAWLALVVKDLVVVAIR